MCIVPGNSPSPDSAPWKGDAMLDEKSDLRAQLQQALKDLRSCEARYSDILTRNSHGILIVDDKGTIRFANPTAATIMDCAADELMGGNSPLPVMAETAAGITLKTRSGKSVAVDIWEMETEWEDKPARLVALHDVTARKLAEEALRNSEEKFSKAFLYAPGLLIVSSTLEEGRIIEVNDAFESVFKYKREEAIGRSALDLNIWADPDDRTRVIQTLHESGEVRDCEIRFRDRSGKVFVGLYSATITEIGGEECLLSILSDITERKRLEEEREQLLTQLDAVLNSIHEGVVISDLEGNVLTMNPAALAMYGFESVEQVRRQLSELQNVFELFDLDGRPLPLEQRPMLRVLRGERFSDCELRVQRKDTGKSWIGKIKSLISLPATMEPGAIFSSTIENCPRRTLSKVIISPMDISSTVRPARSSD